MATHLATAFLDLINGFHLLVTFDMAQVKLDPQATKGRLTGWLTSSQNFVGEDKIRVVPELTREDPTCR